MKREIKKSIVFVLFISLFTSTYAAFLNTITIEGFFTDQFLYNWLKRVPETYLFLTPFVMITGPIVKAWVEKIFSNREK